MTDKTKDSFIEKDTQGRPMIFKLIEKGYRLKVHDKYNHKETVVVSGAIGEDSPKQVTRDCQFLITCLPLSQDMLENMLAKNGSIEGINKGATWRQTSTMNYHNIKYIASIPTKPEIYSLAVPEN